MYERSNMACWMKTLGGRRRYLAVTHCIRLCTSYVQSFGVSGCQMPTISMFTTKKTTVTKMLQNLINLALTIPSAILIITTIMPGYKDRSMAFPIKEKS